MEQQKLEENATQVVVEQEEERTDVPIYEVTLNPRPRVTFDETAIDNEFMGKKKSKSKCSFLSATPGSNRY